MAKAARGRRAGAAAAIIRHFPAHAMEAERINAIVRRLSDVEGRAAELRRFL